jgi:3-dehydroshikimate dehydratase
MIYSGLVSITFRKLGPEEIIELVKKAGLDGIEWGGDVHVPPGNVEYAAEVLRMTRDAGLKVAAYGSYYRVGGEKDFTFGQVLETAKALCAPVIRVWAGKHGSSEADDEYWKSIVRESADIADAAQQEGIKVAFEFHGNTLTDTNESTLKLLREINHKNVRSYWQPSQRMSIKERLKGLNSILPYLEHIHVFQWGDGKRLELETGMKEWKGYIKAAREAKGSRYAMLEFVKDDEPEQFLKDAVILKRLFES